LIRFYWEFKYGEPCQRCGSIGKTIRVDSRKYNIHVHTRISVDISDIPLCKACWKFMFDFFGDGK